jgi:signal transduction histidine kinase
MKQRLTASLPQSRFQGGFLNGSQLRKSLANLTASQIQEQERIRIGHELHDDVNSSLAVAKLYIQMVKNTSQRDKEIMDSAISSIMNAIESIRRISYNLVITQKKDFNLTENLRSFLNHITNTNSFKISARIDEDIHIQDLPCEKKICLYRILQEQLNNIVKYSKAKNVTVQVLKRADHIVLRIADDGIGFDPKTKANGIGLTNVNTRVKEFNGKAGIISAPGKGCTLMVKLPL